MEFKEYLEHYNIQKRINRIAKKYKNKKILLYGAGSFSRFLIENCDFSKLNIVAIADKRFETSSEEYFLNYKTISPDKIDEIEFSLVLIINQDYKLFYSVIDSLLEKKQIKKVDSYALTEPPFADKLKEIQDITPQKQIKGYENGHYYSPVPSEEDIETFNQNRWCDLQHINLNKEGQEKLLEDYAKLYQEFSFPFYKDEKISSYSVNDNGFFNLNDTLALNLFLRKFRPENIIEIGSGFSTLCMTETRRISELNSKITCIEPYPNRLKRLIKSGITLIEDKLQNVEYSKITDSLDAGDLLFIDSSHVYKLGSDVMYIFKKILPNIKAGVYVHFHDIPYPFHYHDRWSVEEGWYWNEAYVLEQFLSYNKDWEIVFWPSMLMETSEDLARKYIPAMKKMKMGGSIYLRKIR